MDLVLPYGKQTGKTYEKSPHKLKADSKPTPLK
jgi:hypothetical protein